MEPQSRLYLSGAVAALAAFLFVSLAFTGQVNLFHVGVFLVFFIMVMAGFATFVEWAETLESR